MPCGGKRTCHGRLRPRWPIAAGRFASCVQREGKVTEIHRQGPPRPMTRDHLLARASDVPQCPRQPRKPFRRAAPPSAISADPVLTDDAPELSGKGYCSCDCRHLCWQFLFTLCCVGRQFRPFFDKGPRSMPQIRTCIPRFRPKPQGRAPTFLEHTAGTGPCAKAGGGRDLSLWRLQAKLPGQVVGHHNAHGVRR